MSDRLEDLGASFQRHLRAEKLAARTRVIYGQAVRFFANWLASHGLPATLDELTKANIEEWLGDLGDRQSAGTARIRWRGMHRFCGWLLAEGEITAHPMVGLKMPARDDKPVPVLTDDQLAALLKACKGKRFADYRDEAMFRFLLDCGVRVSEMTGLAVTDVDLDNEMCMVLGKGSKLRPAYFGARTVRALDKYIRERRRHRWAHLTALFLGERGAMTTDGVRERLKVRAAAAGLPDGLHPHQVRHTWAHDYLINGGQERDLKRLAGWSSDVMLERYGASAADMRAREATKRMRRGDRV